MNPSADPATPEPAVQVGIGVIVLRGGRVLLGRRRGSHGAGDWALPGGHLEFGETPEACAARELAEETGLGAEAFRRVPFTSDLLDGGRRHYLTLFLVADGASGEPQRLEPHKCEGWSWHDWDALPEPLFAPLATLHHSGWRPAGAAPAAAITLHHCVSARSFRALWMLHELGLPHELRMWPFPPRARDKRYFEVNPLGTVPTFIEGDLRMTESAAICQLLAERHSPGGLHVGADEPDHGAYLNALHFGEATLTFPQTLVLRYRHFEPEERKQPQVADDYAKWFLSRLRGLVPRLQASPWLCAGRFTAADVSVGYALMLAGHLGLAPSFPPEVAAYRERLQQRGGFRQALAAEREAALAQGVDPTPAPLA